jgi:hypothetical protein
MGVGTPAATRGTVTLDRVVAAIDAIVEAGEAHGGLFPSLLDARTGAMLTELPPAIHGQRDGDRCLLGSNLIHDGPLLKAMYALAEIDGRRYLRDAADRYLQTYARDCTDTRSGLFGWGEHAFWHLTESRVGSAREALTADAAAGDAIHDHLRQAPLWLWGKLAAAAPDCVQRFADGLDNHWTEGSPREYIRHAYIEQARHHPRAARSCDFPRHSGFYIFDLAFAYSQRRRPETLRRIEDYLEYWWEKKDADGLLLIESRSAVEATHFHLVNAPTQTFSLGVSLLEAACLLDGQHGDLAGRMRRYAATYLEGFLTAPHDLDSQIYVSMCLRADGAVRERMDLWGSVYGVSSVASTALLCVRAWQLTADSRFLEWGRVVGEAYAVTPFPKAAPGAAAVPATDPGIALDLLVDLYSATSDVKWLEAAGDMADSLLPLYFQARILSGAAGMDWYESQMGPAFLLHGLTRFALAAKHGPDMPMAADYTQR